MKLTVEIVNDRWNFSYQIGENTSNASRPIDADSLLAFTAILKYANDASNYENKKFWDEIKAKAWIEGHPQEALDFAKEKLK